MYEYWILSRHLYLELPFSEAPMWIKMWIHFYLSDIFHWCFQSWWTKWLGRARLVHTSKCARLLGCIGLAKKKNPVIEAGKGWLDCDFTVSHRTIRASLIIKKGLVEGTVCRKRQIIDSKMGLGFLQKNPRSRSRTTYKTDQGLTIHDLWICSDPVVRSL